MDDSVAIPICTAAVFLFAGSVKGTIGGGLPTISIGLLSLIMAPAQAAALVVLPSFITNIWQSVGPRFAALLRRMWTMLIGICVGAWLGAGLMTAGDRARTTLALGLALMAYAALGLSKIKFSVHPRHEPWLAPLVGVATGVVTAATGVFVLPAGPYLQAIGFEKDDLVQALGISFTVSTVALAGVLAGDRMFSISTAGLSLIALLAALAGMALGQILRARVREETFRVCFFAGLLLLGGHLALRGIL